ALLVQKEKFQRSPLRKEIDTVYTYFIKELMRFDGDRLQRARIRIDGRGDHKFKRALNVHLRRQLGGRIRDVKMTDSKRDQLTQLADMCIGAIARTGRDRPDATRWADMLRPRIDDVWFF